MRISIQCFVEKICLHALRFCSGNDLHVLAKFRSWIQIQWSCNWRHPKTIDSLHVLIVSIEHNLHNYQMHGKIRRSAVYHCSLLPVPSLAAGSDWERQWSSHWPLPCARRQYFECPKSHKVCPLRHTSAKPKRKQKVCRSLPPPLLMCSTLFYDWIGQNNLPSDMRWCADVLMCTNLSIFIHNHQLSIVSRDLRHNHPHRSHSIIVT